MKEPGATLLTSSPGPRISFGSLNDRRFTGNRSWIHSIWTRLHRCFRVPCKLLGHYFNVGGEGFVPFQNFAGVGGHAPKDRRKAALRAVLRFVEGFVVADCIEKIVVLLLIGILPAALPAPYHLALEI